MENNYYPMETILRIIGHLLAVRIIDEEIIILNDWLHQHVDNRKLFERLFHPDNLSRAIMALNN